MNTLIGMFVAVLMTGFKVAMLLVIIGALVEFVHRAAIRRV